MGAKWSEERKTAASKAALERNARMLPPALRQSNVAVLDREEPEPEVMLPNGQPVIPTAPGVDFIGRSEMFMAKMRNGAPVTTADDVHELGAEERQVIDGGAAVQHSSAGLVWMYKKEHWGWQRIRVSRNSVVELVGAGFLDRCGACGSNTCAGEINQCPATPKVMYRECPVMGCNDGRGHKVYDTGQALSDTDPDAPVDPFVIKDDQYKASTPASRTAAMLDEHIRYYHTQDAAARGLLNVQRAAV